MRPRSVPDRAVSGASQMLDNLKAELMLTLYMAVRPLILVLVNVVWFALLIFAFPYFLKWFLWPLV